MISWPEACSKNSQSVLKMKKQNSFPLYLTPLFYSFGNVAEELFWAQARARIESRVLGVIPPLKFTEILGYKICNLPLFYLDLNGNKSSAHTLCLLINLSFFLVRSVALIVRFFYKGPLNESFFFPRLGIKSVWPKSNCEVHFLSQVKADPILKEIHSLNFVRLSKAQHTETEKKLKQLLPSSGSRYVCLHVREGGFHEDHTKRPYRNADIKTYTEAIKFLVSNDLVVIRLGDPSMTKLDVSDSRIVDYAHSPLRNPTLDLALVAGCEFYIGMQSGPIDLALLFQKPTLTLNMYDWIFAPPFKKIDRGLLKMTKAQGQAETKSFRQRIEQPFKYTNVNERLSADEIIFIDNSPNEILSATKEFFYDYTSAFTRPVCDNLLKNRQVFCDVSELRLIQILEGGGKAYSTDRVELSRLCYRNLASRGYFYENLA